LDILIDIVIGGIEALRGLIEWLVVNADADPAVGSVAGQDTEADSKGPLLTDTGFGFVQNPDSILRMNSP
jgi:hypothetical protein